MSRRGAVLASIGAAAALGVPQQGAAKAIARDEDEVDDSGLVSESEQLSVMEMAQADIFDKAVPATVFISTEYTSMASQFRVPLEQLPKGVGTGFVWDKKGHIITNFHVINKVDNAIVTLTQPDGSQKKYSAKLTGIDPDCDIAVLKIDAPESDLRVLPLGDSSKVRVGQFSFAVGNPFGQDHSLSSGIISGKNRVINAPTGRMIMGVLQTDAAINPGNSGGPLLDSRGRVIGINTAALGGSAGVNAGVGFAVPMSRARPTIEQLIKTGVVERAILGIQFVESLQNGAPPPKGGIIVMEVPRGSPAESAGLIAAKKGNPLNPLSKATLGDVIIGINDDDIRDPADLSKVLSKYKPGDKVKVLVLRGEVQEQKVFTLQLGAYKGIADSKLEYERGDGFVQSGIPVDVPLGDIR